ncbi:MAG: STAS domain-containing protein [Fibrobacteres bacterium]|nr:STAS domain-containing protein [Fibrobacterota bacterium]
MKHFYYIHHIMGNEFSVAVGTTKNFAIIKLNGSMSAKNIIEIRKIFEETLKKNSSIVVDLSGVTLLDSMGVGILVNFYRIVSAKRGQFAAVCPPSDPRDILEVADLHRLFQIFDTMEEAEVKVC